MLHLNLTSAVDVSILNWCEKTVLRELMSEVSLFAKNAEPDMTAVRFNHHFRYRTGKVDRGHIEMFTKLWNLRPNDKTNDQISRIPRLIVP